MARRQVITIEGTDELRRKLRALPAVLRDASREGVTEEVGALADDMRRGAPRDTGELAGSVQGEVRPDGLGGTVAVTARHATAVEYGTSDTPEQPFATPAAVRSRKRFRNVLVVAINKRLGRVSR